MAKGNLVGKQTSIKQSAHTGPTFNINLLEEVDNLQYCEILTDNFGGDVEAWLGGASPGLGAYARTDKSNYKVYAKMRYGSPYLSVLVQKTDGTTQHAMISGYVTTADYGEVAMKIVPCEGDDSVFIAVSSITSNAKMGQLFYYSYAKNMLQSVSSNANAFSSGSIAYKSTDEFGTYWIYPYATYNGTVQVACAGISSSNNIWTQMVQLGTSPNIAGATHVYKDVFMFYQDSTNGYSVSLDICLSRIVRASETNAKFIDKFNLKNLVTNAQSLSVYKTVVGSCGGFLSNGGLLFASYYASGNYDQMVWVKCTNTSAYTTLSTSNYSVSTTSMGGQSFVGIPLADFDSRSACILSSKPDAIRTMKGTTFEGYAPLEIYCGVSVSANPLKNMLYLCNSARCKDVSKDDLLMEDGITVGTWICPEDGIYKIIGVGAGGRGSGLFSGGSGYLSVGTMSLSKGEVVKYSVAPASRATTDWQYTPACTFFGNIVAKSAINRDGQFLGAATASAGGAGGYDLVTYGGRGTPNLTPSATNIMSVVPDRNAGTAAYQGAVSPGSGYGAGGGMNQDGNQGVIVIMR